MTQYFFDISGVLDYLRHGSRFTGIQRVVVTLADAACQKLPAHQAFISYLDPAKSHYVAVPYARLAEGRLTDPDQLRASFGIRPPRRDQQLPSLDKYDDTPVRARYHAFRWRLYAWLGREKYQQDKRLSSHAASPSRPPRIDRSHEKPFATLAQAGDHLVVMDAVWGLEKALAAFQASKDRGVIVHSMLHDLIPVIAPQVMNDDILMRFEPWLRASHRYTSAYLAVSQSTGRDLTAFLDRHGIDRPVRVTPLAQAPLPCHQNDMGQAGPTETRPGPGGSDPGLASQRIRVLLTHPYVLCVGTLEIRKNIWKIAQTWQRLSTIEGLALPRLVFAGQPGWMIRDFERMMKATGYLSGWIETVERASDAELDTLYRHSLFTITASYYEGWGLPIGESLAYGKTAVVSRTSSMPEVGGDMVEYCDPHSIDSIMAACRRLIEDPDHRAALEARISAASLRQWADVADDLLAALDAQAARTSGHDTPARLLS
jgi:glycosyltransferase involved in cell wall biosynthesis